MSVHFKWFLYVAPNKEHATFNLIGYLGCLYNNIITKHIPSSNSHMEGPVVRCTISVGICDVMDGTDSHDHLADGVYYGQIHDSPAKSGEWS